MITSTTLLGKRLGMAIALPLLWCAAFQQVQASASPSFQMQDGGLRYEEHATGNSNSFRLEGGTTWYQQPGASTNYRLVPTVTDAASSAASSTPAVSSEATGGDESPAGGCRGTRCSSLASSQPRRPLPPTGSVIPSSRAKSSSSQSSLSSVSSAQSSSSESVRPAAPLSSSSARASFFQAPMPGLQGLLCPAEKSVQTVPCTIVTESMGIAWWILILLGFILGWLCGSAMPRMLQPLRERKVRYGRALLWVSIAVLVFALSLLIAETTHAATTGPQKFVYNGHLLDTSGNPVTAAHTLRFSQWRSADYVTGDITATGAIHTGATDYAGWTEEHTVTPDSKGYFSVELGSVNALPNLANMTAAQLSSLFLQVEVKASAQSNLAYELMDINGGSTTVDRSAILSLPFAQNADLLDQRDVGTGSGSIPYLHSGGLLPTSMVPGGTNRDAFTIDADSTASGTVTLQFGQTLAKTLVYDIVNGYFKFNDDVYIQGDLTVTGLINGLNLSSLVSSNDTYLRVSSGAGLTVNVGGGSYRLNGVMTNYLGASGISVNNNATNYLFFTSTGLTVNTSGFPTDKSVLPLAQVVSSGGTIRQITDRRVLSSNDREMNVVQELHAEYPNTSYKGDGAENVGQLGLDNDGTVQRNYYRWTSTRSSLQDYDILVNVTLPADFVRWSTTPLSLTYRSATANTDDNKADVAVFDTAGNAVTLTGSASSLVSTSWVTGQMHYSGSPTWTAGQDIQIRIRVFAKDANTIDIAGLKLQYVSLIGN